MKFRPLPPGVAEKAIAGIEDELSFLAEKRLSRIKAMACPRCHSSMAPHLDPNNLFRHDDPLPKTLAKCPECGAVIDPCSGLVHYRGDPTKVEDPLPILKKD